MQLLVVPRTISVGDVKSWGKAPDFQGGVAVCQFDGVSAAKHDRANLTPKLWFYKAEWGRFIAGVKAGALDKVIDGMAPEEIFKLIDTKLPVGERQKTAIPLSGTGLMQIVDAIKAGEWDYPPPGFNRQLK